MFEALLAVALPALIAQPQLAEAERKPSSERPHQVSSSKRTKKHKVLILGDSMAATDFGRALQKQLDAHQRIRCARRGKSATGLARPDFFDWTREAKRQLKKHDPDLVVVIVGGNDGQDLIAKNRARKRRVFWKSKRWKKAYQKRVERFIKLLKGEDRQVAWLELPVMDRKHLEKKLKTIRAAQKEVIDRLGPDVQYVPTREFFVNAKGKLIRRKKIKGWKRAQRLRQGDGIHFSVPGSKYFASRVYPQMLKVLKLEPRG